MKERKEPKSAPLSAFPAFLRPRFLHRRSPVEDHLTPLAAAIETLELRRKDPELVARAAEYLAGDVPAYFEGGPVLYLARHVATPNFETLRFLHLLEPLEMKIVVGQDDNDRFVTHNQLKRALGKLPVHLGTSAKEGICHERFQYATVVDFNTESGKPLNEVKTLWGEPLLSFHQGLCERFFKRGAEVHDDSEWIDRHHRGDLLEHYKKFLALFIVHGILFEDYESDDAREVAFLIDILQPAFQFVESMFGVRPLITHLTPTTVESDLFWMSYPSEVLDIVKEKRAP